MHVGVSEPLVFYQYLWTSLGTSVGIAWPTSEGRPVLARQGSQIYGENLPPAGSDGGSFLRKFVREPIYGETHPPAGSDEPDLWRKPSPVWFRRGKVPP